MLDSLVESSAHLLDWRTLDPVEDRELTSHLIELGSRGIRQVAFELWNFNASAVSQSNKDAQVSLSDEERVAKTLAKVDFLMSLAIRGHRESKNILVELCSRPFLQLDAAAQAISVESFQALAASDHHAALGIMKEQRVGFRQQFMHEYEIGRMYRGVPMSQARQEMASVLDSAELSRYVQSVDEI